MITAYFGPEAEFFIFDDVRYSVTPRKVAYEIDAEAAAWNTDDRTRAATMATARATRAAISRSTRSTRPRIIRGEMLSTMKRMGIKVDKHHHEVATCQHELGMIFGGLVEQADNIQKYKYVIHNVAHAYGKTVTFMPKPMKGDNGSGMHVNMSIWKGGKPLFAGDKYADLSQEALYFIGGILKHAKALNALTNPGTNSYKRLIPGLRGPGSARVFGPQPVGLRSYSVDGIAESQARRGPFPRSVGEPLSRFCRAADGRS